MVISAFVHNNVTGGYRLLVDYSALPVLDVLAPLVPSPTAPNFGEAMAVGDFNADGFGDLVVGNPGEYVADVTTSDGAFAGGVWVFFGGADGLDPATPVHLNQNTPGVPGDMDGALALRLAHHAGDRQLGWDAHEHVDVVGQNMPLLDHA